MAQMIKITGLPSVLKTLRFTTTKISKGITRGLIKGGLHLQRESQKICPTQIGNLKASAFTRNVGGQGWDADVVVGYTSAYAVPVHEDLVAQAPPARAAHGEFFNIKHAAEIKAAKGTPLGTAQGGMFPRGKKEQAKFLEQPARTERNTIISMVIKEATKP